ncbi:MAG: hypothetical protein AAB799_02110 [Patescibacteria group bacterium]
MTKVILSFILFAILIPASSFAHMGTMMNLGDIKTGPQMMQYVEESVLGSNAHEEMEQLMTKMISGEMTQEEASKMIELMNQYPGPYGMMMVRLGSPQVSGSGWNMMSGWNSMMGWGIVWLWVLVLSGFVWLAVGILLVVWLIKKLLNFK